ncbi:MAG: hypothetical protein H0W11_14235 [Gemmatimonadetes bacterium]|nr:hypothetical protein [Gemmatimonadota bacterium]
MAEGVLSPPKAGRKLVDEYFIENRTRLLDIAAFLDRLDRAGDGEATSDFRVRAFREALAVLCDGDFPRVDRIQMIFSDPTTEPLPALDQKSARGAYDHWQGGK